MPSLKERLQPIKLLVLDVDGVLTDGKLYFGADGEMMKAFNTLDGHGIKMLQATGVEVAIISGRDNPALNRRADALDIQHVFSGREDKHTALNELWQRSGHNSSQTAVMGDDWPDLLAMQTAAFAATVPNACRAVLEHADWCAKRAGGDGAVRELCELIMEAQDTYNDALQPYLQPKPGNPKVQN